MFDFENIIEDTGSINIELQHLFYLGRSEACRFIGERIVESIPERMNLLSTKKLAKRNLMLNSGQPHAIFADGGVGDDRARLFLLQRTMSKLANSWPWIITKAIPTKGFWFHGCWQCHGRSIGADSRA